MLAAEAQIETDRASRYLVQLCRHAAQMGRRRLHRRRPHGGGTPPEVRDVHWSDTHGTVSFATGHCTLRASATTLTVRAEAADHATLRRLQTGLTHRLETIGRREHLTLDWRPAPAPGATRDQLDSPAETAPSPPSRRGRAPTTAALIALAAVAITVHIGLAAGLLTSPWAGLAADVVLAMILVKLIVIAVLGRRFRRHRARASRTGEARATDD